MWSAILGQLFLLWRWTYRQNRPQFASQVWMYRWAGARWGCLCVFFVCWWNRWWLGEIESYGRGADRSFLSAWILMFERLWYLNTLSSKSLNIPFLNSAILPERSFASSNRCIHCCRPFYSFTFHRSTDFCSGVPSPYDGTISSPSILTLCSFASLISLLSPLHSYGGWRPSPLMANRKWVT